ncbi:hypothetical protein G3567_02545 [Psychroflexus sp. YR1-1]|uniref:Uncharacterized protein n=1 Tax=Psychroflexus aurantiacus TaxID=2709310 RepID=A0A6B3R2R4_9FLAO|nr:hypothetical protein [Psychroflexus aurantiacus]NEV93025.1 hypothetical protein [Psychroflexus aurantiacus]
MNALKNQSLIILFLFFSFLGYAEQESTVLIARNNGFTGSGAPAHIFVDYDYLGKLKNKNYIEYKTNKSELNIAVVSNLGSKKAISVSLEPQQTKYINVNLSKLYFLEDATEDEELRSEVLDKVNSKERLAVSASDKKKYLSRHKDKLQKAYASLNSSETAEMEEGNTGIFKMIAGEITKKQPETNSINEASAAEVTTWATESKTEENGTPVDSVSVADIYKNYLAYIDPNNQLSSLKSMTKIDVAASGVKTNGMEMSNNYVNLNFVSLEGKIVGIMKMESMSTKTVFDGNSGYTKMSNGYETQLTPEQAKLFKQGTKGLILEQTIPEDASVSLKEFDGKQVYSVSYTSDLNGQKTSTEDFYDISSFQKLATKSNMTGSGINTSTTMLFKDYKDFNGILQPQLVLSQMSSTGTNINTTISVQSQMDYKFNETFDQYANQPLGSIASSLASIPSGTVSFDESSFTNIASVGSAGNRDSAAIASALEDVEDLTESEVFNSLNKREQALQLMLRKKKESGSPGTSGFSVNTAPTVESSGERERISKMDAAIAGKLKYRRSSLYTMMVDDNTREHYDVIKDAFGNTELSEKFNQHNIGPYLIPAHGLSGEKDQTLLIEDYLNANNVAKNLVAKWFNRDEKGHFNMDLIAERGQYNASDLDIKIAQSSIRGKAILSDAGRELLRNTFVVVYDYKYTNKEEQANKRRGFLDAVTTVASFIPGAEDVVTVSTLATAASDVVGKGYFVRTTSYLYRLVWNEEVAQEFYTTLWTDETSEDPSKRDAFDTTDLFKLEYVGSEVSRNNLQSTIFTSKSNEELIEIATIKAVDKNIGKLQRSYEQFRVKTPLLSAEPIAAKIGLKEGLERNDKFEVLEQVLNEDGTTSYERVATIRVDNRNIWDNTYLSEEAGASSEKEYTLFKGNSNKLASGMLIRQLK